jgi:hypothetical protein
MLNSNVFIILLRLPVRAAIDGSLDLPGMVTGVLGRPVYGNVASIGVIGMRTIHPAPMAHLAKRPTLVLCIPNRLLDLLLWMLRSVGHGCVTIRLDMRLLTFVNSPTAKVFLADHYIEQNRNIK